MVLDQTEERKPADSTCWLFRCEDGAPFAFARGHDFIRVSDHTLWSYLRDGRLLSARSGDCLARQEDRLFVDESTGEPVFYVPASCELPGGSRNASSSRG
ncbi:MAG TPA: hypothetical protein VNC41_17845 [Acidimicrobiia bacterium]|nr:hypothetical protein [Acidimicrobiia bacterium]